MWTQRWGQVKTGDKSILKAIQDAWEETKNRNAWFDGYPNAPPQRFTGTLLFMPMIQALIGENMATEASLDMLT